MRIAGFLIYIITTRFYFLLVRLLSPFNNKAKLYTSGRKEILSHIRLKTSGDSRAKIWFHCASLGEFEQARPVMEELKKSHQEVAVVVTFFSPSGYEIRKNYQGADYIFYLPDDSRSNARAFIETIQPVAAIFTKYEFWYFYLLELHRKKIPVLLISALFRKEQLFFKPYASFYKGMLHLFTHIFTQNETSVEILKQAGITQASKAGDTRFDRVWQTSLAAEKIDKIARFKGDNKLIVAGSSYPAEEGMLAGCNALRIHRLKLLIAPHEISEARISDIEKTFAAYRTSRFSRFENEIDIDVLIMDNVGMLASAYSYANVALVGGGFGQKGLHNILEPATFGIPVFYGPNNHDKFPEALALAKSGGGFIINNANELNHLLTDMVSNQQFCKQAGENSRNFIEQNRGATQHILLHPIFNRLLYKQK